MQRLELMPEFSLKRSLEIRQGWDQTDMLSVTGSGGINFRFELRLNSVWYDVDEEPIAAEVNK